MLKTSITVLFVKTKENNNSAVCKNRIWNENSLIAFTTEILYENLLVLIYFWLKYLYSQIWTLKHLPPLIRIGKVS